MTNTTQKLTISDIQQATTVAELTKLWGLSQDPDACEKPASKEVVGGKLLETCINNFPTCSTFREAKEICEALCLLGLGRTEKGCGLIRQVIGNGSRSAPPKQKPMRSDLLTRAMSPSSESQTDISQRPELRSKRFQVFSFVENIGEK